MYFSDILQSLVKFYADQFLSLACDIDERSEAVVAVKVFVTVIQEKGPKLYCAGWYSSYAAIFLLNKLSWEYIR